MAKKDPQDQKIFLKYFIKEYIAPCAGPMPTQEAVLRDIYTSTQDIWNPFYRAFDTYRLSQHLKNQLIAFFNQWDALWMNYLNTTTEDLNMGNQAFSAWSSSDDTQTQWREIQSIARQISRY